MSGFVFSLGIFDSFDTINCNNNALKNVIIFLLFKSNVTLSEDWAGKKRESGTDALILDLRSRQNRTFLHSNLYSPLSDFYLSGLSTLFSSSYKHSKLGECKISLPSCMY